MVNAQCLKQNHRIDARFLLAPIMPTDLIVAALKDIYQYLSEQECH